MITEQRWCSHDIDAHQNVLVFFKFDGDFHNQWVTESLHSLLPVFLHREIFSKSGFHQYRHEGSERTVPCGRISSRLLLEIVNSVRHKTSTQSPTLSSINMLLESLYLHKLKLAILFVLLYWQSSNLPVNIYLKRN